MPISTAILVAAGIGGGVSAGQTIFGASKAKKAEKQLKAEIKRMPKFTRPEEYNQLLQMYKERANAQEMPGQSLMEGKIGASVAQGVRQAQKGATSSASLLGATTDLYGRKMEVMRDLGIQSAQFRSQRQAELGQVMQMGAGYSEQEFSYNKWLPSQMRMNMYASKMGAGQQSAAQGVQGMTNIAMQMPMQLAQLQAMQGMQPTYGATGGTASALGTPQGAGTGQLGQMSVTGAAAWNPYTKTGTLNPTPQISWPK